jgi:hypothetical protein
VVQAEGEMLEIQEGANLVVVLADLVLLVLGGQVMEQ